MATLAKFKVDDRVSVMGRPQVTGVVRKAKDQAFGWCYEVRLDETQSLCTYLEAQLAPAPLSRATR